MHSMNNFLNVLSHKQVAPSSINHQGLYPSTYPRGCNLGFSIDLRGVHLYQDHIKMYIDQGVHFQIVISNQFYVYLLSLLFSKQNVWNAGAQLIKIKSDFTA